MVNNIIIHRKAFSGFFQCGSVILLLVLFISLKSYSQKPEISFQEVDQTSYQLYTEQNWDSLVSYGQFAIKHGHNYFTLQLRLGIAYFNMGDYLNATRHLLKAEEFNKNNSVTKEYLHLSYVYTNRKLEAHSLMYVPKEKGKPGNRKIIKSINLETGPIFSNNISKNKKNNLFNPAHGEVYGEQDLNGMKYYTQLGIKMMPAKRISIYVGYNNLMISKTKQIQYLSNHFPIGPLGNQIHKIENDYTLYQNGIYANINYLLTESLILIPAIHYISVKYNTIYSNFPPGQDALISVSEQTTTLNNLALLLGINKTVSVFNVGLYGSWSNLNYAEQYQAGGSFSWFPKGNLDLYLTSKLVLIWEGTANRNVFDQLIGYKAAKQFWVEGGLTFGEILNYNENNGYIVYNSGDKINFRATGNIIVPLENRFELSFRYQFAQFESEWYKQAQNNIGTTNIKYNNHLLIGGIKWIF